MPSRGTRSGKRPPAVHPRKAKGIEITEADDGYIVYQPERDRVHYMNRTAALVIELCTGKNSWDDIIDLVKAAYGLRTRPVKEVSDVLTQVIDESLVTVEGVPRNRLAGS